MSADELSAVNRQFEEATNKGDAAGMAAVYTEDAMVLPPDAPLVKGRENIQGFWGVVLNEMALKQVKLDTVDLEIAGDTACQVGEATLTLEPAGGDAATVVAKFVVYWKKVDGAWRWHRDIWNM